MKRIEILVTALFVFVLLSCKAQVGNPKDPQPTKEAWGYKGGTDQTCAVEVSFGSYGSGIDGTTFTKVTELIEKNKLKYTSKNIGREGETRLCLPLKELKGKKKTQFINQLKSIVKEGQLTSLSIR